MPTCGNCTRHWRLPGCRLLADHQIARAAPPEMLDVFRQLINEALDGFTARPGHVRCEDEVGKLEQTDKRMIFRWRLDGHDIESRTGNLSGLERCRECVLVNQSAARRIDQQR